MALKRTNLKRGIYTSPQSGNAEIERYVIENDKDLKAFVKEFQQLKHLPKSIDMIGNLKRALKEGHIIILTDENRIGFPTYCFENTTNSTHPSSYNRVRLIN